MNRRKLVVLNVAALSPREIGENTPSFLQLSNRGSMSPLKAPEPSLTCPSHATMLTGLMPKEHGIIANGWYDAAHGKIFNWGRSNNLVEGEHIWDALYDRWSDAKVVNLFWRFCTHSKCHLTLTERPTYFSNGRKGADVYSSDEGFKKRCIEALGPFPFFNFWGPKASLSSSRWILDVARLAVTEVNPDLLLCYAPGLDYDVQRFGPYAEQTLATLRDGDVMYGQFIADMEASGYDVMVVSDYGFTEVSKPVFPNRVLREAGFVAVDNAVNGEWLEPAASRAFAVCDNQIAHIYVRDVHDVGAVKACLEGLEGVERVICRSQDSVALGHKRSGQLLIHASKDHWFAYPYWLDERQAPDFSTCVDIFNKPGFDPCELFLRPGVGGALHAAKRFAQLKTGIRAPFDVISTNPNLVRGSRAITPVDDGGQAALITSWARSEGAICMTQIKNMILGRMVG